MPSVDLILDLGSCFGWGALLLKDEEVAAFRDCLASSRPASTSNASCVRRIIPVRPVYGDTDTDTECDDSEESDVDSDARSDETEWGSASYSDREEPHWSWDEGEGEDEDEDEDEDEVKGIPSCVDGMIWCVHVMGFTS